MIRRWLVPFGTRPEIIKLAPVVNAMRAAGLDVHALATGQHHGEAMADAFFRDLGFVPDEVWTLPADEAERVGVLLSEAYRRLATGDHDAVLVLGDTHTVPLFALAARRFGLPLVHVEAGLRSYNARSIEEGNRRVATTLAALHFAPTADAAARLRAEGVAADRIVVVGNPITDSLRAFGPPAAPVGDRRGVVVTVHRPTNVDDPQQLQRVAVLVEALGSELGDVVVPLHPRTRDRLGPAGVAALAVAPGVTVCAPLAYTAMLETVATARVVVTDSGGLQEEASWYGVPSVVLRNTTPRWEGVANGSTRLVGTDIARALQSVREYVTPREQLRVAHIPCPYGDGAVGLRIAKLLLTDETQALLGVADPLLAESVPKPGAVA